MKKQQIRVSVCAYNKGRVGHIRNDSEPDLKRVKEALQMAHLAKSEGADLAVFPEICFLLSCESVWAHAEPLDGPTFQLVSKAARELEMFIAVNHPTLLEDGKHNTTVLFNRQGQVEGCYHKAYPTRGELAEQIVPGKGAVVLETEIGRLGFATCFDLNFPELRESYRQLQPDMILFCSIFPGRQLALPWALETGAYFVGSIVDPGSQIIDPLGRMFNEISGLTFQMTQTIGLDYGVYHLDHNNLKINAIREQFGDQVQMSFSDPEGIWMMTAVGKVPLCEIEKKLGLVRLFDYFTEARTLREQALTGVFPEPGPSGW